MQFLKWEEFPAVCISQCNGKLNSQDNRQWSISNMFRRKSSLSTRNKGNSVGRDSVPKRFQVKDRNSSRKWTRNFNSIKFSASDQRVGRNSSWKCQKHYCRWFRRHEKMCSFSWNGKGERGRSLNDDCRGWWPDVCTHSSHDSGGSCHKTLNPLPKWRHNLWTSAKANQKYLLNLCC